MRRWLRQALLVCAVILAPLMARQAAACVCRGKEPPCFAYQEASAVFAGVVVDVVESFDQKGNISLDITVRFSVEQPFKGLSGKEVNIDYRGTECDINFAKGERFFIYAYRDPERNRLVTGICARTARLLNAVEDLAYAREVSASLPRTRFCVRIVDGFRPVKGIRVIVKGEGREYKAVADGKEFLYIELAKPGKYWIAVTGAKGFQFIPLYLEPGSRVFSLNGRPVIEFERTIDEGRCDFVDFDGFVTLRKQK